MHIKRNVFLGQSWTLIHTVLPSLRTWAVGHKSTDDGVSPYWQILETKFKTRDHHPSHFRNQNPEEYMSDIDHSCSLWVMFPVSFNNFEVNKIDTDITANDWTMCRTLNFLFWSGFWDVCKYGSRYGCGMLIIFIHLPFQTLRSRCLLTPQQEGSEKKKNF